MANSIDYVMSVDIKEPILIEGLPGVGNVGKLAADLMAEKLGATLFGKIYSSDLPPQILIGEDCVPKPICIELRLARVSGKDVIFILGESQATTPNGQYDLTEFIFKELIRYDPSLIITLGGYGTGDLKDNPKLLGLATDDDMKPMMESAGIGFYPGEPKGGVVGAAALFLTFGQRYNIPALSIIGETSGYILDHRSARNVVHALNSLIKSDVDTGDFDEFANMIDEACQASIGPDDQQTSKEDLSYIQ